jgi:beta-fructofuranosidase
LSTLRGNSVEWRNIGLEGGGKTLSLPKTNTLEIRAEIVLKTAESISLGINSGANNSRQVAVNFSGSELKVMDDEALLSLVNGERKLSLRIFIDHSVLEIFANGTACVTKIISLLDASATLEIRAQGGTANVKLLQAWPVKTIW